MAEDQLDSKVCSRCRELKPISAFGNNRIYNDGKSRYCRTCARNAVKTYLSSARGKNNNREWQRNYRKRVKTHE
jgi:hypothetical protein